MPGRNHGIWPAGPKGGAGGKGEEGPELWRELATELPDFNPADGPQVRRLQLVNVEADGARQRPVSLVVGHEFDKAEADAKANPVDPWSWENAGKLVAATYSTGAAQDGELACDPGALPATIGIDAPFHYFHWLAWRRVQLLARLRVNPQASPAERAGLYVNANSNGWGGLTIERDAGLASQAVVLNAAGGTRTAVAVTDQQATDGIWLLLEVDRDELVGRYSVDPGFQVGGAGPIHPPSDPAKWAIVPGQTSFLLNAAEHLIKVGLAYGFTALTPMDPAFYRPRSVDPFRALWPVEGPPEGP